MNNHRLGPHRVIVKRKLYDNGKEPPVVVYASINRNEAIPGELLYKGKFVSYGRRPGNLFGQIIELWQEIYVGEGEPETTPHVS